MATAAAAATAPRTATASAAPPLFDAAAKRRAQELATTHGKPNTKAAGLLAIHAARHRKRVPHGITVWDWFGAKKQRYYEWAPLILAEAVQPTVAASFDAATTIATNTAAITSNAASAADARYVERVLYEETLHAVYTWQNIERGKADASGTVKPCTDVGVSLSCALVCNVTERVRQ